MHAGAGTAPARPNPTRGTPSQSPPGAAALPSFMRSSSAIPRRDLASVRTEKRRDRVQGGEGAAVGDQVLKAMLRDADLNLPHRGRSRLAAVISRHSAQQFLNLNMGACSLPAP